MKSSGTLEFVRLLALVCSGLTLSLPGQQSRMRKEDWPLCLFFFLVYLDRLSISETSKNNSKFMMKRSRKKLDINK